MSENINVKIPKAMVDHIQKQPWFKYYHNLDDFVVEATRRQMENWMRTEAK